MRLTFKYPVYPTQTQEKILFKWFDHLCELQNSARHDRIVALETEDRFVSLSEQQELLTAERTTNKRKDFIGKLVYKLYHHYENNVLIAEDLKTSNMVRNKYLSKSISDASWATFFKGCADIAERDGLHFHQVDPKNTSQTCSCCGEKSKKKLSLAIRTFTCKFCGISLDRDHNAARNILYRAAAALRGERWVTTLREARNKNEARDMGLQGAIQLSLFDTPNKPKSLGLGS